jgi:hypothetical protein
MSVTLQFQFPMRGKNTNFASSTQPQFTSPRMMNVRPREVLGKRARGGQRPGLAKQYNESLGGPVVAICSVVTVEVS